MAISRSLFGEQRAAWWPYALTILGVTMAVAALASASFWFERERSLERAATATQNVANLLESQMVGDFDKVDIALRSIAFGYREALRKGAPTSGQIDAFFEQQTLLLPELDGVGVVDKDGVVKFRRGFPAGATTDLSDRGYFIRARANPDAGLQIDGPIFARAVQRWVMVFARPLIDADGHFAGIVYARFPTQHFQAVLAKAELGPHGAVSIRTEALALVHRNPLPAEAKIGATNVSQELRAIVRAHPERGQYLASTALDGIERINAYQKIGRYPFYAIVGMATDDYLGDWRRNSLILAALTGMVILTVIFATWALYRASLRQANQTRVHAALQELAARDGLTGVANRRCFDETLEKEWLRTRREASPLSLLMLDVDHFKHYNDTYGHQKGDECLKLVAAAMLEETQRSTDLVARYGGEEFAVVLPGTSAEGAATVAERIRARVEGLGVPHAGLHGSALVTVSLGVATAIASPERDLAQLLAAADAALYRAKHKGRNSVVTVLAGSLEVA